MPLLQLLILLVRLIWPIYQIKLPEGITPAGLKYLSTLYIFNRNKATLRLDYEPLYNHDEAQEKSLRYYEKL